MKTPRELLLARHQAVEPQLDAVRRAVLGSLHRATDTPSAFASMASYGRDIFRLLHRFSRLHWAALGAVWVLALMLNHESPAENPPLTTGFTPPPPRQILVSIRENRRQLREWLETPVLPPLPVPQARIRAIGDDEEDDRMTIG